MIGHELAVEQGETCLTHRRDKPCQRDFAGIGGAAEHAFAAKYPLETDAVEPADQLAVLPAFDGMGVSGCMQCAVARFDPVADPAFGMFLAWGGAFANHIGETGVASDVKAILPQHFLQAFRKTKPVERNDRSLAWLHPVDFGIAAVVGHGENAATIGAQQKFDRNWGRNGSMHRLE